MNNINPTIYEITVIAVLVFFMMQYLLLKYTSRLFIRLIPIYLIIGLFIFALFIFMHDAQQFNDLKNAIALIIVVIDALCIVSILLAYLLYKKGN